MTFIEVIAIIEHKINIKGIDSPLDFGRYSILTLQYIFIKSENE
jgi:hypothetical protein